MNKDKLEFYRSNPCIAVYELLGVDLIPIQKLVFEDMWFKDRIINVATKSYGKTFLNGLMAVLSCLLYPEYRTGIIAPTFRQSKMIFSEVEKLYSQSSILREASEKGPVRTSDLCYLEFKNKSGIDVLPGNITYTEIIKYNFNCLLVDEFSQISHELIESVMYCIDKTVFTSSGYYKFCYMYKCMKKYWKLIGEGSKNHAVYQIPYTLLPEGFLDSKNIENAERVMSTHEFRMEYMAEMVSDPEVF